MAAVTSAVPVTPAAGRLVQLVSVPLAGVPNTGAVSVLLASVSVPANVAIVPSKSGDDKTRV